MKKLVLALCLLASPAFGQGTGTIPNKTIPVSKGPGVAGWGFLTPGVDNSCVTASGGNWVVAPCPGAAGSGVSSLGGAVGTLTLGTGLSIPGNVLTYTQNASTIGAGTLAAARGGAGTINGALKGNGSGVVSQAACADLSNAAASCATDATVTIQTGTGATSRTVKSKLNEVISVTDFGAVCDGTTDDTTAFTNAIAAAANSKLVLPPGVNCKVKGSGSYIFTISAPMIFDCQGSSITLDATVPNTRGLFLWRPLGTGDRLPKRRLTQCLLDMNGVGAATNTIDTTATNTTEIGEFEIDHVRDTASGTTTLTNASIFVNNIGTNTNGGTFNSNFHDNVLLNGIYLNVAGDSIRIRDNILSGTKYGVYAQLISGAAGLIVEGNNVSAATPLLIDASAGNLVVNNNEFEQQITNTDPGGAVVDFRGGSSLISLVTFTGNSVIALASTGNPIPLKISNVSQAYAENNSLVSAVAGVTCLSNAGAGTIVGASNLWGVCTTHVTNTGTLKYVQVGLTP